MALGVLMLGAGIWWGQWFLPGVIVTVLVGAAWLGLTLTNLQCEGLAESYRETVRFDWATGCMLELDDGREVQVDESSIALIVRELIEEE